MDLVCDLVVEDDAVRQMARRVLVDCLVHEGGKGPRVDVRSRDPWEVHGQEHRSCEATPQSALRGLLAAVNLAVVAETGTLAFHAAVLTRGVRTLVLPARSGTGKSTLTAALVRQGWGYVSDEALALDWDGARIHPYARPLSLSAWSIDALGLSGGTDAGGETVLPVSRIGTLAAEPVPPVSDVVLLERPDTEPRGANRCVLERVGRQPALVELLQRGFTHHRDPETALATLTAVVNSARTWRLVVGPPDEAAALLSTTFSAEGR